MMNEAINDVRGNLESSDWDMTRLIEHEVMEYQFRDDIDDAEDSEEL